MSDPIQDQAKTSERKRWHTNGRDKYVAGCNNGRLDGSLTTWYETGVLCATGAFKKGKLDGIISRWDEHGELEWKVEFNSGKFLKVHECPASADTFIKLANILYTSADPAGEIIEWAGFPKK